MGNPPGCHFPLLSKQIRGFRLDTHSDVHGGGWLCDEVAEIATDFVMMLMVL